MMKSPVAMSIVVVAAGAIVSGMLAASTVIVFEKTPEPHLLTAYTLKV